MTALVAVLKVIGIVLAVLLVILLLLLLVHIRYHLTEKGGSSETYGIAETRPEGELTVSWLLHFLHGSGKAEYHEKTLSMEAHGRILGIPVLRLKKDMKVPPEKQAEIKENPAEEEKTKDPGLSGNVKELFLVLKEDRGGDKTEKIKKHLGGILKNVLPRSGHQKIWFGTGDPFDTAAFLGVAAFFYPLYKNTIEIIPDMAGSSLYTEGDIRGKIFAGSILYHAAILYFDRDIKNLLQKAKGDK